MILFRQIFELPKDDIKVFERISKKTHQVNFGLFNFVKVGGNGFGNEWLGNVSEEKQKFKLFRVKSPKYTSDFVLKGRVSFQSNKTTLTVSFYPFYMIILGYMGVLITAYFISPKVDEFYEYPVQLTFGIMATITTLIYTILNFKDYKDTLNAFQELIDPKNDEMEKRVYRD